MGCLNTSNFLLNHHLHRVSYSASICTWCPSITLEIVLFFSFSIKIFIHTKEDIKRVQQIMPKIGQLKGATEVHLLVFEDGNRKKIFQVIVHGGQFGSKNLIWMIRIFEIYCSQGMILNSCDPPPYFCSPNLHFQGISFASIISLCWDIWKYGPFI